MYAVDMGILYRSSHGYIAEWAISRIPETLRLENIEVFTGRVPPELLSCE